MIDCSAALQVAMYQVLSAGLQCRVYDRVPNGSAFPYVTIGDDHTMSEYFGSETFIDVEVTVHVWSRSVGRIEAKTIAGQVRAILDAPFAIEGFRIIEYAHTQSLPMIEADGHTTHNVMKFTYLLRPIPAE